MSIYPDYHAVDTLVHGVYTSKGFVYTDRNGVEQIDDEMMKDAVYQQLLKDHVVSEPSDVTPNAVTRHELYEAIFPDGPGEGASPRPSKETHPRSAVPEALGLTGTGVTGYCNKRVEAEGSRSFLRSRGRRDLHFGGNREAKAHHRAGPVHDRQPGPHQPAQHAAADVQADEGR